MTMRRRSPDRGRSESNSDAEFCEVHGDDCIVARSIIEGDAVLTESLAVQDPLALISTGLFMEIPKGFEVQIRARSGLAIKYGIGLVNGIGTIDEDYRGEIKIPLINFGEEDFTVNDGDRIAQMVAVK